MGSWIDGIVNAGEEAYDGGAAILDASAGRTDEAVGESTDSLLSGDYGGAVDSITPHLGGDLTDTSGLYSAYSEADWGLFHIQNAVTGGYLTNKQDIEQLDANRYDAFGQRGYEGWNDYASNIIPDTVSGVVETGTDIGLDLGGGIWDAFSLRSKAVVLGIISLLLVIVLKPVFATFNILVN